CLRPMSYRLFHYHIRELPRGSSCQWKLASRGDKTEIEPASLLSVSGLYTLFRLDSRPSTRLRTGFRGNDAVSLHSVKTYPQNAYPGEGIFTGPKGMEGTYQTLDVYSSTLYV